MPQASKKGKMSNKFPATWDFGYHNYDVPHLEGQFTGIGFVNTNKLPDANLGNELHEDRPSEKPEESTK